MLDALADYLVSRGHGTRAQNFFTGFMPDKPDDVAGLFHYAAEEGIHLSPEGLPGTERPRVQLRVRGGDRQQVESRIRAMYDDLHFRYKTLSGINFRSCYALQGEFSEHYDSERRLTMAANFQIAYDRSIPNGEADASHQTV